MHSPGSISDSESESDSGDSGARESESKQYADQVARAPADLLLYIGDIDLDIDSESLTPPRLPGRRSHRRCSSHCLRRRRRRLPGQPLALAVGPGCLRV
jgi:hypothetical protein